MQKKLLVVTELFTIAINYFDAKISAHSSKVLLLTELVVSGTRYNLNYVTTCALVKTFPYKLGRKSELHMFDLENKVLILVENLKNFH